MPQITYNIELSSKPDKLGRWSVMVRLHLRGQRPGRVMTSVKIVDLVKYWLPKKWGNWVRRHEDAVALNTSILNESKRIQKQVEKWQAQEPEGSVLTPAQLAERFRGGTSDYYFEWMDKVLNDAKEMAYATYIAKRSSVNSFKAWVKNDQLPLQSVTPSLVRSFQNDLTKSKSKTTGTKLKGSSINKLLDRMHVLHQAVLVKTGISPKQAAFLSPWTDVTPIKEEKPKKDKLSEGAIERVSKVKVETTRRRVTPEGAFQIWMIERVFAGMRFSDVMQLRYQNFTLDDEGQSIYLKYEMLKTGNVVSIPVFDEGRELLKSYWKVDAKPTDYVLPYMDNKQPYAKLLTHEAYRQANFDVKRKLYNTLAHWNRQVNLCLKQIQIEAGLVEPLRTHNARHSFAELARKIMQQDKTLTVYDIQLLMGHSSVKITEGYYADANDQDSNEAMQAIFNRKPRSKG